MALKMMWKKIFAATIASSMVLSMAAYCENAEGSTDPFGACEETVTVEFGALAAGDDNLDNPLVNYIREVLNIEMEKIISSADSTDYANKLSLSIAAEDLPDIFGVYYDRDTLDELVENEMIADLTEVYEKYASDDLKALYDSYDDSALEKMTYDGKLMALPRTAPEPENLVWIRQDWVDELGIALDEDENHLIAREELEMVAKEFMDKDPGESGNPVGLAVSNDVMLIQDANLTMTAVNSSFGVFQRYWFEAEDGSLYNGSTSPEAKEALAWWADMYSKGILDPQFGVRDWDGCVELLTNGQLGIAFGEMSLPKWLLTPVMEADPDARFVGYALDNGDGKAVTAHYDMSNRYMVVSSNFKHPELLIKIANILVDTKNNASLAETHPDLYAVYEENKLDSLEPFRLLFSSADSISKSYTDTLAYLNGDITIEELHNPNTLELIDLNERYQEDPSSLEAAEKGAYAYYMDGVGVIRELQENGLQDYVSPLITITTDTTNSKGAELEKLEEETWLKIIIGEESVEYFDTFVEEWNSRGGERIAEEIAEKLQ